jgi:protein translocase SecG subunit
MNQQIINIIQIVLAFVLVGLILLQAKGAGLGSVGGDFGFYGTKRGAEKLLFILTIVVATLFLLCSLIGVILSR